MDKKFTLVGQGCAVAEIKKSSERSFVSININPAHCLSADESFVCFKLSRARLLPLGTLNAGRGEFETDEEKTDALAVARYNKTTRTYNIEMWGENPVDKYESVPPSANLEKPSKKREQFTEKSEFSFEDFFGMDFSWKKIGGHVIPYSYKILRYVMSSQNVYQCINSAGHYMLGEAQDGDVRYFAAAVPEKSSRMPVFKEFSDKVYTIKDGNLSYKAVCMGVDKSGEFFVYL